MERKFYSAEFNVAGIPFKGIRYFHQEEVACLVAVHEGLHIIIADHAYNDYDTVADVAVEWSWPMWVNVSDSEYFDDDECLIIRDVHSEEELLALLEEAKALLVR